MRMTTFVTVASRLHTWRPFEQLWHLAYESVSQQHTAHIYVERLTIPHPLIFRICSNKFEEDELKCNDWLNKIITQHQIKLLLIESTSLNNACLVWMVKTSLTHFLVSVISGVPRDFGQGVHTQAFTKLGLLHKLMIVLITKQSLLLS